jgi:hypothetical protein
MLQDDVEKIEMRNKLLYFSSTSFRHSKATEESHQSFLNSEMSRKQKVRNQVILIN